MKPVLIISSLLCFFATQAQNEQMEFFKIFSCVNGYPSSAMKCSGGYSTIYTTGIITSTTSNPTVINITAFPWDTVRINGSWSMSYCFDVSSGTYYQNGISVHTSNINSSYYDVNQSGTYSFRADWYPPDKIFNITFISPTGIVENAGAEILITPVPVRDVIAIKSPYSGYDLTITDLSGNKICAFQSESETDKFDVSFLRPGIYIARFTDSETGMWQCKKFVKI